MIFIEVALTRDMSAQVQPLLDPESLIDDPARATCAMFYSITNCQQGLRGVSFGNVVIKQVVDDPVARFHLANGARLERLNWLGDTSPTGLRRSFGLTVNYVYRLADLERNQDAYANRFRVATSRAFQQLTGPRR